MILFSICDFPWWLLWLLPLLIGALLWWLENNKYNKKVAEYEGKIKGLNGSIRGLEEDLAACRSKRSELESDLALTKGRMREMEAEMNAMKVKLTSSSKDSGKKHGSLDFAGDSSKDSGKSESRKSDTDGSKTKVTPAELSSSFAAKSDSTADSSGDLGTLASAHPAYAGIASDNLQIIEGIGPKMESVLKENGINNLVDLSNQSEADLRGILGKYGDKYKIIDPTTWSRQAKYATAGDFDGLIDYQKKLDAGKDNASGLTDSKLENMLIKSGALKAPESETGASSAKKAPKHEAAKSIYAGVKSDNLQIIEGIGPKMESVLKENGINNLTTLGSKSESDIQAILNKYGDKYKIIDPKTWSAQAQLAGAGKYDELIDYQKKLDTGKDNAAGMTDSKLEKYLIKTGALKAFKQDDLKAIEGIGPATDKLLRENGINTWRELANTSVDRLKSILTNAGSRFGLSDPTTWPKQAELAADGKFDELREYQDFLDGGKA